MIILLIKMHKCAVFFVVAAHVGATFKYFRLGGIFAIYQCVGIDNSSAIGVIAHTLTYVVCVCLEDLRS